MKLTDLKPGQKGVIKSFLNNDMSIKLLEMGCIPGEEILLENIAPLGDPISVSISGYSLSLRLKEAEEIIIDIKR
jgi:ferrous iron transport protein A